MNAFSLDRYGNAQALCPGYLPDPVPGSHEVLLEIQATEFNPFDSKIRDGAVKPMLLYRPPVVLGPDLAGIVLSGGLRHAAL